MMGYTSFPIAFHLDYTAPARQRNGASSELTIADLTAAFTEVASSVRRLAGKQPTRAQKLDAEFGTKIFEGPECVRVLAARDEHLPLALLEELATDESSAVRSELIFNRNLSWQALSRLSKDADRFVAAQAKARLSLAA